MQRQVFYKDFYQDLIMKKFYGVQLKPNIKFKNEHKSVLIDIDHALSIGKNNVRVKWLQQLSVDNTKGT